MLLFGTFEVDISAVRFLQIQLPSLISPLLFCFTRSQSSRRQWPGWRYGRAQECCHCPSKLRRSSASHFDSSLLHNAAPTRNHNSTSIRMTPRQLTVPFRAWRLSPSSTIRPFPERLSWRPCAPDRDASSVPSCETRFHGRESRLLRANRKGRLQISRCLSVGSLPSYERSSRPGLEKNYYNGIAAQC